VALSLDDQNDDLLRSTLTCNRILFVGTARRVGIYAHASVLNSRASRVIVSKIERALHG
jgi:hypothetical protein